MMRAAHMLTGSDGGPTLGLLVVAIAGGALLLILAWQIITLRHNATRYQAERTRRLLAEKLCDVGRALSRTLDLHEVLDLILDDLRQILAFDRGAVLLAQGEELEIMAACGFPPESNPLQIRVSIKKDDVFRKIYHTGELLAIDDVLGRPDWQQIEGLPLARAWLGVPLINAEDQVIGMLSLARERPTPYTRADIENATAFAGQAAIALQNARLYSQLAYAYEQLARLDRAKSDFITVASHELRTPLTLLRGFSEVLWEEPGIQAHPTYAQMVQGICDGAARLQQIVDRMVSMAEIDTRALHLHIEPLALAPLIQEIVTGFAEPLRDRDLTVTETALDALPTLEGDALALHTVFSHLITNAIKYTPDGGAITISGQCRDPGYREMPSHSLEIVVADEGIGIPAADKDLIFTKFYHTGDVALHSSGMTKFKGGGPGLGLAIVRGIVETHHGQVWVESPGYDEATCPGSRFYVLLPLRQPFEQPLP